MFISDLKPNQAVDEIVLEIVEKGPAKEFMNYRGKIKVVNATVKDSTGDCNLTLWNDDGDSFENGDKVKITNGWCKEYRGEIQVSSGKYGNIEKLGAGDKKSAPKKKQEKADDSEDKDEAVDDEDSDELFAESEDDELDELGEE